jgi:hypothetical protein
MIRIRLSFPGNIRALLQTTNVAMRRWVCDQ